MGRPIVYCDLCGQLLKEDDFTKGKASFQDNRNYCVACRPLPAAAPPAPPLASSPGKLPALKSASSSRIPRIPGDTGHRLPSVREPLAGPPPGKKPAVALIAGIGGGGLVLLAIVIAAASGGGSPRRSERPSGEVRVDAPKPKPVPPPSVPRDTPRDVAARQAVVRLLDLVRTEPGNLGGQWKAAMDADAPAKGTEFESVLEGEWVKLRKRLSEALGEVELEVREPRSEERYRAALDLYEAALKQHAFSGWTEPLGRSLKDLQVEIESRFKEAADPAVEARRKGSEAEGKAARERIAKWGLPDFVARLDAALADAAKSPDPKPPTTAPAADARAKEAEAYAAAWKAALLRWPASSPGEAVKALEAAVAALQDTELRKSGAADLDDLKAAAAFASEAPAFAAKLARGQKGVFAHRTAEGGFTRVEGTISKIDAQRIEVLAGEDPVLLLAGDLGLASVADAWRARPAKKETDARAAALACLLEGDAEGAERIAATPERLKVLASEAAAAANGEKDRAARALWVEAEIEFAETATRMDAVARFKSLLSEHGTTGFVSRNRAYLASRTEAGREAWFPAADLKPVGEWKLGKAGKIESAWVTAKDLPMEQIKSQYVDLEFAALAETDYKAWVLAGGCCQEVFSFYLQGTELLGPDPDNPKQKVPLEPGSGSGMPAKPPTSGLKKRHADHTGPKEPDRFEWISLGTFRYTKPGAKTIRILANQKGFAVAWAAVTSLKSGTPSAADLKEQERLRSEVPGATVKPLPPPTGRLHREIYRGIGGGLQELLNHASFKEGKPSEAGGVDSMEALPEADDFGTRLRGYVYPPVSGSYVFMISADDWGELYLSPDEDPAKKGKIAVCPEWTHPRTYDRHAGQASASLVLKAGRRYYIEILQKEAGGGAHVSVAWKMPDGQVQAPIPMDRFAPFTPPVK